MYPRNAASPPRIAIGAVIQISDGAVQSSGVSVVVRSEGGSESAGGGTVSYGASSSVVYYTPTQGETNYTAFVVTAYKTGCIPVSVTIVTTAESTSGKVSLGAAQTTDIAGSLSGSVGSVSGAVGSISGVTFPSNFASLGINGSGHVSRVTLVDTTTTNTDMRGTDGANTTAPDNSTISTINSKLGTPAASVSADIAAVKTVVDGIDGDATAANQSTIIGHLTDIKGAGFVGSTDSLEGIRDRGDSAWLTGGDSGSGANSVSITVDDGTDPLESAKVRVTKGAETYLATTDASGDVSFSLDNGTWAVAITLPGYTFTATTLVVDGVETQTYSMTATGLSVPDSPRVRARLLVLDKTTKLGKPNVDITIVEIGASTTDGYASEAASRTVTSDANGLAEWYALPGEKYSLTGPLGLEHKVKIAANATDPHSVDSILA